MVYPICKDQILYNKIAYQLRQWGIVSREQSQKIKRYQSRKRRYWIRHIRDLCSFALESMERNAIDNPQAVQLCKDGILYYEAKTHETGQESEGD